MDLRETTVGELMAELSSYASDARVILAAGMFYNIGTVPQTNGEVLIGGDMKPAKPRPFSIPTRS